ncbi:MAG TPA: hypothetical protein VG982_02000 [Candidatus Paceibacterota bacterium]|nr:hypothetical protein [Candidatus Paceibacterota bacterium]
MNTNSIWLVGSYVVPLAALTVFAVLYFIRYKRYVMDKNGFADCQFLEDLWKGYIFARLAFEKHRRGSRFWWFFFGSKYVDLVNFHSQQCVYELDQLDRFEESHDVRPCFNRKSFMRHWKEMHSMLFKDSYYSKGEHTFDEKYGSDPFGWMTVMIKSKLFELYKKRALQLLRTRGYYEFSNFLSSNYDKSKLYPHNAAFSIIASGECHLKIMEENSQEIGERVRHEVKEILCSHKTPKVKSQFERLRSLVNTFVIKAERGHYNCPGLSEIRKEIDQLLEKEKIAVP